MRTKSATGAQRGRALALGAAGMAMGAWGFGGILVKLTSMDGLTLTFYRLWLGAAVMLLALIVAGRRLTWSTLWRSAAGGAFYGIRVAMFLNALKRTSVADVMLIGALQPSLVLTVAGPLFGESVSVRKVVWTLVSIGGIVLVIVGSAGTPLWSLAGDLFAVGSLLAWTGYWLVSKRARADLGTVEYFAGVMLLAAMLMSPVALLGGLDLRAIRAPDWGWLAIMVLGPGVGGHLLMGWAHRYIEVSVSSLLAVGTPVISVVAAWALLGEPLGGLQIAGAIVVVAAIAAIIRWPAPGVPLWEVAAEPSGSA